VARRVPSTEWAPRAAAVRRGRASAYATSRSNPEQVGHGTRAAGAVETGDFSTASSGMAARDDAFGELARVISRMADEARTREHRLRAEIPGLRIEIDEARQPAAWPRSRTPTTSTTYAPRAGGDRRIVGGGAR
jgi:hypothetical protein